MKKIVLLLIGFLFLSVVQIKNPIEKFMKPVTNPEEVSRNLATINGWNSSTKPIIKNKITPTSDWELLYCYKSGWHENTPNQRFDISELYTGIPGNRISGATLLNWVKAHHQDDIIYSDNPYRFNLLSIERNDPYNGKWVVYSLHENRINLCYIHSYPNGNQSSWLHKTEYIFQLK